MDSTSRCFRQMKPSLGCVLRRLSVLTSELRHRRNALRVGQRWDTARTGDPLFRIVIPCRRSWMPLLRTGFPQPVEALECAVPRPHAAHAGPRRCRRRGTPPARTPKLFPANPGRSTTACMGLQGMPRGMHSAATLPELHPPHSGRSHAKRRPSAVESSTGRTPGRTTARKPFPDVGDRVVVAVLPLACLDVLPRTLLDARYVRSGALLRLRRLRHCLQYCRGSRVAAGACPGPDLALVQFVVGYGNRVHLTAPPAVVLGSLATGDRAPWYSAQSPTAAL